MADLTKQLQPTIQAVYAAWEEEGNRDKGHRPHLGASLLGNECRRALWYTFRWATDQYHSGRLLRLFERGQLEEKRFINELKAAGIECYDVDDRTNKQFQHSDCAGHVGGSMDGVGRGFLESPKKWHVLEFKTHSEKSFNELRAKGVEQSKPLHFAQMQLYMHWSELERAFYLAVNKNTDELYSERIRYNEKIAEQLLKKAWDVVQADRPLERMTEDMSFYLCKFCNHYETCHKRKVAAVNCRTCLHANPEMSGNGTWSCANSGNIITTDKQRIGCENHRFIPDLVPWAKQVDANEAMNWIEYELPDGTTIKNGGTGERSYTSEEIQNIAPELVGDDALERLRAEFDGRVVG